MINLSCPFRLQRYSPHRSCPYTSQQNGRAEWKHRHILDVVCTLLISAFTFSAFRARQHSLLFTLLIMFHHWPYTTNHLLSSFMVKPLTTYLFGFFVVLVLSLFLLMNEQSSSLVLVSVAYLDRVYPKRVFIVMTLSFIAFVFPVMLSSRNIVISWVFSNFLCPLS